MQIQPLPYDTEALSRFEREGPFLWLWEPDDVAVVLGAGTPATDANQPLCGASGVPVYRRKGGGGAVVLSPGNLIITGCYDAARRSFASQWIHPIAAGIAAALTSLGVKEVAVRGLGDVTVGDKKILGSSLYANRKVALYQGSLLVNSDLDLIPAYLPHPSREPDYRKGRSHLEFVTTLQREGYPFSPGDLVEAMERYLSPAVL